MNDKGSCKPRPESRRLVRHICMSIAVLAAASCGGGGGTTPSSTQVDLIGFPAAADPYEGTGGDGSAATASELAIGSTQSRTLYPAADEDYAKVTLAAGTAYEFSANRLNYTGDTELFLYGPDGTSLVSSNDDYIGLDSRILFTPTTAGTYYLKVEAVDIPAASDDQLDVASYMLGVRVFRDADGDTFSQYYDCNDARNDIFPLALETVGDGVDQDCSGADVPTGLTADIAEDDDSIQTARVMAPVNNSPFEPLSERAMYLANTRSLTSGDSDHFSIEIPARGAVEIDIADDNLTVRGTLYGSNGTQIDLPEPFPYFYVVNAESAPKTIYVKYEADTPGASGYYIPFYASLGVDLDGDTYYTQDWIQVRDCNDGNSAIHPGAADTTIDGVDQNCDGRDGPP